MLEATLWGAAANRKLSEKFNTTQQDNGNT